MDPIIATIAALVGTVGLELLKKILDNFSERAAEQGTKELTSSLNQAKAEKREEIPHEVLSDIEAFYFKTENRALYEVEDPNVKKRCIHMLKESYALMDKAKANNSIKSLAHAYNLIKHVDSLIIKSQSSRWYVLILLVFFIVILSWIANLTWNRWSEFENTLILGIPFPVLLWGAIGSGTAPLYKYLRSKRNYIDDPIRWFIVRPFIGMIMGAAIYLVVKSGLLVFGNVTTVSNPQLLWILAFIGGFSETATGKALRWAQTQFEEAEKLDSNGNQISPKIESQDA